ncbi:MAG: TetR/AcrR family transcriptional regulator [Akkermansiaceae bacterium]|nr:TetR/AcrR family transcriptional regulator [Akkermansiaceae bacterium]
MSTQLSRKEQSHERIVEVAARAIRRAGYRGVGVADIMKEAGLTHGGFYAHFASREALLVEAMQEASRGNQAELSEAMARRMVKGHSRFSALVWAYLHDSHLIRTENGCVVAALSSEMTRQGDVVHQEARRRVTYLVEFVRSSLPQGVDPEQAEVVTATMVGALQLARTLGGTGGRNLLVQTREALLQKHQPDNPH